MAKTDNYCYKWQRKYLKDNLNPFSTKNIFEGIFFIVCVRMNTQENVTIAFEKN